MTRLHSVPFAALLLKHAEHTVNRWIGQSSSAADTLRSLEGRTLCVDIDKTGYLVRLAVHGQRVRLSSAMPEEPADIVIKASPFDLLHALRAESPNGLAAGEMEFRGSVRVAEQFAQMLRLARPSLEDELAGWIGGLPARAVTQLGNAALERLAAARASLELDTVEYLRSELRELPLPEEIAGQTSAVEQLRDRAARLEQRIDRLAARWR